MLFLKQAHSITFVETFKRNKMKKVGRILVIALLSIIGILLIGFLIVFVKSPGKLDPLKDENGKVIVNSLVEKNFIEVGGIRQGFFIRSENPDNPVILFLHGGPGSPELPLFLSYETSERLEKYFTVCHWVQRGAGMSFTGSMDATTMTVEQMVEDTRQMTEYLQHRFNQKKIYLIGHSWGTLLGIKTIEKYPENYLAYIGIGQVSNQLESEKLAYDYMLQHATEINDKNALEKLKKYDRNAPDFPSFDYMAIRSLLMNRYGIGMMHQDLSMVKTLKDFLFYKGYTVSEKINYIKGSWFSLKQLFYLFRDGDLFESSVSFDVPIYIVHGKYDYQVSYALSREYFDQIEAPEKDFFTFENSAHSPNVEESEKFVQIVRKVASNHPLLSVE
jgi:pimeloyl-ACP methyl ester carboxylesterase